MNSVWNNLQLYFLRYFSQYTQRANLYLELYFRCILYKIKKEEDRNMGCKYFFSLILYFLSFIVMVSATCSYSESYNFRCKTHYTILNQNSISRMLVSDNTRRMEFHYVRLQHKEKGKVLRLRWVSVFFGPSKKNILTFRIG